MGLTHDAFGRPPEASQQYADAVSVRGEISDRWGVAQSLHAWGDTEARLGAPARARALWTEALAILTELGDLHADAVAVKIARSDAAG